MCLAFILKHSIKERDVESKQGVIYTIIYQEFYTYLTNQFS